MFSPFDCDDPPPISFDKFDVERTTITDAEETKLRKIDDVWDGSDQDRKDLGIPWRGETTFDLKPGIGDQGAGSLYNFGSTCTEW